MNGQGTKRPMQRRIINDVQPRRWAGPVTPLHPISVQAELKQASRELTTFWQHLGRMLQTAGHSWGAGEHDVFLTPLYKLHTLTRRFTPRHMQRWQMAYFAMLVLAVLAIPASLLVRSDLRAQRYQLSAASQKLVGEPVKALDKQLSYDVKTAVYQYNSAAATGIKPPANGGDTGVSIGGSNYYGVNLAATAGKGQTFTDAQTKLSFTLVPQFGQLNGKHEAGHVVYPIDNGQVVYTLKDNGLKEDVVLSTPTDSLNLSYRLHLPAELEAKLLPDGSVGIYSANPSLFGNITYGSSSDMQAAMNAREYGAKTNLVFQLPAPQIVESVPGKGTGKVSFSLSNDVLTVAATHLQNLSYPLSIDPSVIINSANSFKTGNNEDDNSLTIAAGSITRGSITGGTVAAWGSTGANTFGANGLQQLAAVVYNSFIYITGGVTPGGAGAVKTTSYASITTSGTIGSWTTSTNQFALNLYAHSSVAYNGYLYVIGGLYNGTATSNVQYALICTGSNSGVGGCSSTAGSIGTWSATSPLPLANGSYNHASVVYNGYVYVLGGCGGNSTSGVQCKGVEKDNDVLDAQINADGTLGTWRTEANAAFSARWLHSATVYNGYVYVAGGCTTNTSNVTLGCIGVANDVWYARFNSDGTVGTWNQTSSFTTARQGFGFAAYNGYMYVFSGCAGNTNCNSNSGVVDTQYAPIYANGTLGTWTATAAPLTEVYASGFVAYGNYLFTVGGCTNANLNCGSGLSTTSTASKIDAFNSATAPNGSPTSWGAGNAFSATIFGAASVAYNGFVYTLGGCTTISASCTPGSTSNSSVVYAAVCTGANATSGFGTNCSSSSTPGTTSGWASTNNMTQYRYDFGVFVYDGYMYAVGGCSTGTLTSCSTAQNTVERAAIQSDGSLGSWASAGTFAASGLWGIGVASYNGYAYITGGANTSGTVTGNVLYASIGSIPVLSTWSTAGTALSPGLFGTAAVAYGGYLYVAGGSTSVSSASGLTNTVQYTPLTSGTGAPGTWSTSSTYSATSLTGISMQAYDGVIYIIGGASSTPTYQNAVLSSPVQSSGALGSTWTSSTFTGTRQSASSAIANGYLFVMGGYNASITNTTQIATLQTQDRVVHYSRIIDIGTAGSSTVLPQVTRYLVSGTAGGSTLGCASYATTASAAFGTVSCGYTTPYGIFGALTKASTRYVFVYIAIDDSQQALFNDSNPSSITGLSVMFHSNPARRLRGGQTFTDNNKDTVNQLDTEGP